MKIFDFLSYSTWVLVIIIASECSSIHANKYGSALDCISAHAAELQLHKDLTLTQNLFMGSTIYKHAGLYDYAIPYLRVVLHANPKHPVAHWELGDILLINGNYEEGFEHFKYRWWNDTQLRDRLWNHEDLQGKRILIAWQWDISNIIHFLRYIPILKKHGATIIMQAPITYHPFLAAQHVDEIVIYHEDTHFDYQIPITYLPKMCNTTMKTIPHNVPYINIDPTIECEWEQRLCAYTPFFNIGLYLDGPESGYHWVASDRMPKCFLKKITGIKHTRVFSLKPWPVKKRLYTDPDCSDPYNPYGEYGYNSCDQCLLTNLIYFTDAELGIHGELVDLAALMKQLQLVVTDNTTIAALAGALGIPVLLLLPVVNDWIWIKHVDYSPWYPTIRLIRQTRCGFWHEEAEKIIDLTKERTAFYHQLQYKEASPQLLH